MSKKLTQKEFLEKVKENNKNDIDFEKGKYKMVKLEHIIKKVFEPLYTGGWEVRFRLLEDFEERINAMANNAYFETVEYV